jgi:hypothetical protein
MLIAQNGVSVQPFSLLFSPFARHFLLQRNNAMKRASKEM